MVEMVVRGKAAYRLIKQLSNAKPDPKKQEQGRRAIAFHKAVTK